MMEDRQVAKMFKAYARTGDVTMSAAEGGMSRDTAKRYLAAGSLPSQMKNPRSWRTRQDPFGEVWPELEGMLKDMPELEGKTLFEYLQERHPGRFSDGQLRTLQRRVRQWRAIHGPDQEVFFGQVHEPGKTMQLDWMHTSSLNLTVRGQAYEPLLCHCVLQYSAWEWAVVCRSESYLSLQAAVQEGCLRLGGVPAELVTDNSSAATHQISRAGSRRELNEAYVKLLDHYDMRGRATNLGCPQENGTAESMHGHLRRRLKQALLLRGHADFEDEEAVAAFIREQLDRANANRLEKVRTEQQHLHALPAPLPDYQSLVATVGSGSTITVKKTVYSVPSRLVGRKVDLRIYEQELQVRLGPDLICTRPRVPAGGCGVDYRDLVAQMLRKPGAFAAYRWKEAFFPQPVYRQCYVALAASGGDGRASDTEYLRLLNRAVEHGEDRVAEILRTLLARNERPSLAALDQALDIKPQTPQLSAAQPDPGAYDSLLSVIKGGRHGCAS
jgi:transposase